jgi:hypothetical protein
MPIITPSLHEVTAVKPGAPGSPFCWANLGSLYSAVERVWVLFMPRGLMEIESEWTARDRELKTLGGLARTFLSPG